MTRAIILIGAITALAGCVGDAEDADELERKKPKPGSTVDAGAGTTSGVYTCYATSAPAQTCTTAQACCFDGTFEHSGSCSSSACTTYGSLRCDGPEDCSDGQKCCATITRDGVTVGCAAECLPYFEGGDELCHEPSFCSGGRSCITAYGTQPALPRTVSICR